MIILKYHLIFYILNKQNSRAAPSLRSTESQPSAQWFIKKKEIVIKKIWKKNNNKENIKEKTNKSVMYKLLLRRKFVFW